MIFSTPFMVFVRNVKRPRGQVFVFVFSWNVVLELLYSVLEKLTIIFFACRITLCQSPWDGILMSCRRTDPSDEAWHVAPVVSCRTYMEIFHYKVTFFLKPGTICLYFIQHLLLFGHYIERKRNSSSTLKDTGLSLEAHSMCDPL